VKSTEYLKSLKDKSVEELQAELVDRKKELFNLRFQNATNQLDNTARINVVRKNIARVLTEITERANKGHGDVKVSRAKRAERRQLEARKAEREQKAVNKKLANA
jgi:large subunit ribosomal protein L29